MRRDLGESLAHLQNNSKPLAQVTTPSLEALQRYSAALDLYGAREYVRCIALAKDALELDENFAMAHLLMGKAYEQSGDESNSRAQIQLARSEIDRVGEREKHLILAADFSSQGMYQREADEYRHLLDIYPNDVDSLREFAQATYWAGHPDEALAARRKVLSLAPDQAESYQSLTFMLVRTSRFSEALKIYDQARIRGMDDADLKFSAAMAHWGNDDLTQAKTMLDSLGEGASEYWKITAIRFSGEILAHQGRLRDALTTLRSGLALAQRPGWEGWRPIFQYQIAKAELGRGVTPGAKEECRNFAAMARSLPTPANLQRAVKLSIASHDLLTASQLQRLLEKQVALHPDPFAQMELFTAAGSLDLAAGRTEGAIQNQERALAFLKEYEPYLALGEACQESRNWACAADAYKNYMTFKGEILIDDAASDFLVAQYSLAKVYSGAGDGRSALPLYQKLTQFLASADKDLAILSEPVLMSSGFHQDNPQQPHFTRQ